jgi:hypothetical protein
LRCNANRINRKRTFITLGLAFAVLGAGLPILGGAPAALFGAIAVGLASLFWYLATAADTIEVERKIAAFDTKLEAAQRSISSSGAESLATKSVASVQKIQTDFEKWADDFTKQRQLKRLQIAKSKLDRETLAAEMTAKWKPYLSEILATLRGLIEAYNAKSANKIKLDAPPIPEDLFATPYEATVSFRPNAIWRIDTLCNSPPRTSSIFSIRIFFGSDSVSIFSENFVLIEIYLQTFDVFAHGRKVLADIDRKSGPTSEFTQVVPKLIQQLVEAQLLEEN